MKLIRSFQGFGLACLLLAILISCPTPTTTTTQDNVVGEYNLVPANISLIPFMSIPDNKIYNASYSKEYSLNDKVSWTDCNGGVVSVTFAAGNIVWVREKATPAIEWFLGQVAYTSGYADLYPSGRLAACVSDGAGGWLTATGVTAGQAVRVFFKYTNIGSATANQSFTIQFYLSTDTTITTADTLWFATTSSRTMVVGPNPAVDGDYRSFDTTLPSLPPGRYYLGYMLDTGSTVTELNESNNTSPESMVREVIIKDSAANSQGGAFKIVNSWGTTGSWENVNDGHYWTTYATMKALQLPVFYYYNNFSVQYKPTVIAVFRVTHAERDKCKIVLGLGSPTNPIMTKEFQAKVISGTTEILLGGALPFPGNDLALDISEFAESINSADLFLSVITSTGAAAGTLNSLSVNFYSVTTGALLTTVTGTNGAFAGSATTNFTAVTTNALAGHPDWNTDIIPPLRSVATGSAQLVEEQPAAAELAADMAVVGVFEPGKNYNRIVDGQHGTGLVPPSSAEWQQMKKLRGIYTGLTAGTYVNQSIDHSKTKFFPPIGNQGSEGSCTCYSAAYYIHTYTMAREFNWDLNGTTFGGVYPGAPQSNQDKIFSPDFVYHQINRGVDNGSSAAVAYSLLSRMGGATWAQMPYNQSDSTTWPSAAAFLEAAKYRGREVNQPNGYLNYGYIIVRTDADINLLKNLVQSGYCLTCSIDADASDNGVSLYQYLDANDVVDNGSLAPMTTNHAQTIVGFKDGTSWHKVTPDD
jgi:hypothetical protein